MLKRTICAGILLAFSLNPVSGQDASTRIVARYRQLLEANPSEGTALDRLWKIYQDRSATTELLEIYRKDESFAGQMLYGFFSRKAGQLEIAAHAFSKAAEIDPKKAAPHLALADLATKQGRPKKAAIELSKAADLLTPEDPSLPDILMTLGKAYAAAGESENAAEVWERTVTLDAGNIQLRRQLAQSYESNDLPERAIPHYRYIRKNGSAYERAMALRDLARVHQVLGEEDSAIESLEEGISLTAPGNWLREELQAQLVRLHQRYDRVDELEKKWQRAVEKNPRDLGVYLQLLALYRQLGEQTRQRELLETLVALAPRNLEYKTRLAKLVERAGDSAEAARLFDEILEAQPGNLEAALTRASIELREGKIREASDRVEAFLADHPNDETARPRAMEFFSRHRLYDNLEKHLRELAQTEEGTLALCRFLFAQDRAEEARLALSQYLDSIRDPDKKANAFQHIAQLFRDQGDFPRATEAMAEAALLRPDSAEIFLALGELYVAAGDLDQAKRTIEKAYDLAENEAARSQADEALFQTFQAGAKGISVGKELTGKHPALLDHRGRINLFAAPLPGTSNGTENVDEELAEFVNSLAASAERSQKVKDWLRVAVWQMRIRRFDLAMRAAASALEIDPGSVAARQTIVKIATANGLTDVAVEQLKMLAEQAPENADRYRKQLADLRRASGEIESALRLYQSLLRSNPGDIDCIADLALTMQQSGRWGEALKLWRKANALSSPNQRKSVISHLIHALKRSGRHREAADLLLESVDLQEDATLRLEAFRDLLAFAIENHLLEWLRGEFESRHGRRPNDYFIEVALSRILKSQGLDRESFEFLRTAAYSAPDPLKAFEELAEEAEALGRVDAAIEAQKRLITLRGDENPGSLRKLAEIQTRALEINDAYETWKRLVNRYPRDLEILYDSAKFFAHWRYDDDATAVLRTARVLYPNKVAGLMQLAQVAERSGRSAEALSCYDQVLRTIPSPDRESDEDLTVPDLPEADEQRLPRNYRSAFHSRGTTRSGDTGGLMRGLPSGKSIEAATDAEHRLNAIRGAGRILAKDGLEQQREGWLERWSRNRNASRNEMLWAFYVAGDKTRTLDLLERMMRDSPDNPYITQAFVWLALEMKGYEELARWLADPACRPQDRDLLAIALGQYLDAHPGTLDPNLVSTLFPPEYNVRQMVWQAAALLANSGHLRRATILGERVLESAITNRANYGMELARWNLILGDQTNAKRLLEISIRGQTGDTPDAPVFEALRSYFLLLPPENRSAFVESYVAEIGEDAPPIHSAIARALLYGLLKDREKTGQALLDLYHLHPISYDLDYEGSATYRAWNFLLAAGLQFQQWNLDGLAGALWDRALRDQAALRLDGRQAGTLARDIRVRLAANNLVTMPPIPGRLQLEEFLSEDNRKLAPAVTNALESTGFPQYSIRIYHDMWQSNGTGMHYLRSLINACRAAKAFTVGTDTLIASMESVVSVTKTTLYRDLVLQFARFLLSEKELSNASRLLDAAENHMPNDPMVLEQKARLASQKNDPARAESLYRRILTDLPGNSQTRLQLAGALDEQGKTKEAIAILEQMPPGRSAQNYNAALGSLYLDDGQAHRAETIIRSLVRANAFDSIPGLVEKLAENGNPREAQRILYGISERLFNDENEFLWRAKFLELIYPMESPELFRRTVLQLRDSASENPDLWKDYLEAWDRIAKKHGLANQFQDEVEALWDGGNGPFSAGAKLVELHAAAGKESKAAAMVTDLFGRPDYDGTLVQAVATHLAESGHAALAADIALKITERNPFSTELAFNAVELLNKAERRDQATQLLEKLCVRAVVNPELAGKVGQAYQAMGLFAEARNAYQRALLLDPYARSYSDYVNYAKLLIEMGDLEEARRVLRYSFRNPANSEVDVLVELVAKEGSLAKGKDAIPDFPLTSQNLRRFTLEAARQTAPR